MRCAILADIHGNYEALRAVLDDIDALSATEGAIEAIWCLGDIVGYGPDPSACVRTIRAHCAISIAGNHDWAAVGQIGLDHFSPTAAESARWTRDRLTTNEQTFLGALPETVVCGDFTLAHGSPSNPLWQYLLNPEGAAPNFQAFQTAFCVVGHTHLPAIFLQQAAASAPGMTGQLYYGTGVLTYGTGALQPQWRSSATRAPGFSAEAQARDARWCDHLVPTPGLWLVPSGYRAILNPGSVGQPRDGDPRAAYVVYDSQVGFEFRRVAYRIDTTQRKMQTYGFPRRLATRLARGR